MDFSYSQEHLMTAELAHQIFSDQVDDAFHLQQGAKFAPQLWQTLAEAGLLGAALSEESGGSALGFIGGCVVLQAMGAVLAPLPLLSATTAAMALDDAGRHQCAGELASGESYPVACADSGLLLQGEQVSGTLAHVPFARGASRLVAVADQKLLVIDLTQPGVTLEDQQCTNGLPACQLSLDTRAEIIGGADAVATLRQRLQVGTAMLQLGVLEEALRRTAEFTVERKQFGQALARFQAVSQRAANGYIDIEALRATAESAMWRLHQGLDATLEAATALWWASEAGHRVSHTGQHLHGGIGSDLTYPIHRYFLWAKQLEFSLGGAAHSAAAIGEELAENESLGVRK